MPPTEPRAKLYYLGTGGPLLDPRLTAKVRERLMDEVDAAALRIAVLDLGGAVFSPGSLQELLLPLVRRLRAGEAGAVVLVIIAEDRGVADFVHMLAFTHSLPLYVTDRPHQMADAEPVGRLTPTELQTINAIGEMGGRVTVAAFADHLQLQVTAAGNRLANLDLRGYVYREQRSRRDGDIFVDPRWEASEAIQRPIQQSTKP